VPPIPGLGSDHGRKVSIDLDFLFGLLMILLVTGTLLLVPGFPGVFVPSLGLGGLLAFAWLRQNAPVSPRDRLVRQLQLAYSGELAAALAYAGHSRAVRDLKQKERIRKIEDEEWHHRRLLGDMLRDLGAGIRRGREFRAQIIGRTLSVLCHVSPWFFPMYGAGRLERGNVQEYEDAAAFARAAEHSELVPCLLDLAETEWEHETYFRSVLAGSPWLALAPLWAPLPPKETIRERHESSPKTAVV
jgi:rubrerythrin